MTVISINELNLHSEIVLENTHSPDQEKSAVLHAYLASELLGIFQPEVIELQGTETHFEINHILLQSQVEDLTPEEIKELTEVLVKYPPQTLSDKSIYLAAAAGDGGAVRKLIKYHQDKEADRSLILENAIKSKSLPLVKYLVEEESYFSDRGLYMAIQWDSFECFDFLLSKGWVFYEDIIDQSIVFNTKALKIGSNINRIKFLLSRGAKIEWIEEYPNMLIKTIYCGDLELLKFLLENGAGNKMNELPWHDHPLSFALSKIRQNMEYAHLIMDYGGKIDPKYSTEIWNLFEPYYCKKEMYQNKGLRNILAKMINNGLPVYDSKAHPSHHILYSAVALWKDADLVEALLKNGADPNTKNGDYPVIFFAQKNGSKEIVALLLMYGATPA